MVKTRKSNKKQITRKRNNKRKKRNHKTNKHKMYKKGGKVIASGGYGCVFEPSLQCRETGLREQGKISKLMINKYAVEELDIINNIRDKLSTIPNYSDYFLVDGATVCKPSPLTENDLGDFDKKCSALTKRHISKMTISRADVLDYLTILNLPNGGLSLGDFIKAGWSYQNVYLIQLALLKLLKNGIIPMNEKHIYHNDIKDSNILVDTTDNKFKIRLIDWGFLTEYVPGDEIPKIWKSRPFAFNEPFSLILFSERFYNEYTIFNLDYTDSDAFNSNIDLFLINYIRQYEHLGGHFAYIMKIFFVLYKNNTAVISAQNKQEKVETDYALPIIKNYLKEILLKFTPNLYTKKRKNNSSSSSISIDAEASDNVNNGEQAFISMPSVDKASSSQNNQPKSQFPELNSQDLFIDSEKRTSIKNSIENGLKNYLDSVFIKNVDIWGFIMCYLPIISFLSNNYGLLNKIQKDLFETLKRLVLIYLFFDPNDPILDKTDFFETLNNTTFILQEIITPKPTIPRPTTSMLRPTTSMLRPAMFRPTLNRPKSIESDEDESGDLSTIGLPP